LKIDISNNRLCSLSIDINNWINQHSLTLNWQSSQRCPQHINKRVDKPETLSAGSILVGFSFSGLIVRSKISFSTPLSLCIYDLRGCLLLNNQIIPAHGKAFSIPLKVDPGIYLIVIRNAFHNSQKACFLLGNDGTSR
jgi:hypothetical protein